MAPEVRLIALDLDGTLLDPQNRVSGEDAAAVRDASAAGITIVLSTSRWHLAARRTAVQLGLDGYIISHNGALVRSCDGQQELLHHRIDAALAMRIAEHVDAGGGDGYVTVDDLTFVRSQRLRDASRLPPDLALCESLTAAIAAAPTAFLLFGRENVRATVEAFREHHGRGLNLAEGFSETFPDYLNIVHSDADKGRALVALCAALGIAPAATMAVGDAAPDIAMLKVAGIAVAMGNASPDVKAIAHHVAPPNTASGVAAAIRKFALPGS